MASSSSTVAMVTCLPLLLLSGASVPGHRRHALAWLLRRSRAEVALGVTRREPKPTKHAARGTPIKTTSRTDASESLSQAFMVRNPQRGPRWPSTAISKERWGRESRAAVCSVSKIKVSNGSGGVLMAYWIYSRFYPKRPQFDFLTD